MRNIKLPASEQGQSMSEFAIVMPILVLLIMGMVLASMYAFRAAASDWGVFVTGVGAGTFNTPADEMARKDVLWPDIRSRILTGSNAPRRVQSSIAIDDQRVNCDFKSTTNENAKVKNPNRKSAILRIEIR